MRTNSTAIFMRRKPWTTAHKSRSVWKIDLLTRNILIQTDTMNTICTLQYVCRILVQL